MSSNMIICNFLTPLQESHAKKQAELDQLLEEHHQLVSHIEELEKVRDSSEGEPEIQDGDD